MDAAQIGIGLGLRHRAIADRFRPSALAAAVVRRPWCRADQQYAPIQPVDLDIDASGFLRAAPDEHGGEAHGVAATQMGLYPYCGFNAHGPVRCGGTAGSAPFAFRQSTRVGEFGDELVGDLARDRPAAIGFELANGGTCLRTDMAIEPPGPVAESSQARLDLPDPLLALFL